MVSVLFDSELMVLLPFGEPRNGLAPWLIGEAMTRRWLYDSQADAEQSPFLHGRCSSGFIRLFEEFRRSKRLSDGRKINWAETAPTPPTGSPVEQKAWEWMVERIRAFRDAHGVIAVVETGARMSEEAIALPFRIAPAEARPGTVRDQNGRTIGNWNAEIKRIQHLFPDGIPMVTIDCDCGSRADLLEGGSLALAIVTACWKRDGFLCDYDGLEMICTGSANFAGKLTEVGGKEAKRNLARRLGAQLFVCPGDISADSGTLAIPTGTLIADCRDMIRRKLEEVGVGKLDVFQAHTLVRQLTDEVHEGLVPLARALTRLKRYEAVFSSEPASSLAEEGKIYALTLHGSIANHSGNPQKGRYWTQKAAVFAHKAGQHELYAHAMASSVVSLTDLGLLDQAEKTGRALVKWIDKNMRASAISRLKAKMEAQGALGGQPLLQKALTESNLKAQSLEHLQEALSRAKDLRAPKEIARGTVQIALWYALLEPHKAGQEIAKAQAQLDNLGKEGKVSELFLRQYRFLAAYRKMLLGGDISDDYEEWPLPDCGGWIRAVTLKYRGTLLANAGNMSASEVDFSESIAVLDVAEAPLLRFIGATVALQAATSLQARRKSIWRNYAKQAKAEFMVLKAQLFGPHRDCGWRDRADGLLAGLGIHNLPNPQLVYRY